MTVTNTAATVARNSHTDSKSCTSDLGLHSIVLLKRQGQVLHQEDCLEFDFSGVARKLSERENDGFEAPLRTADLCVVEKLDLRLLNGDGLPKSAVAGLMWFKKSAELGKRIGANE